MGLGVVLLEVIEEEFGGALLDVVLPGLLVLFQEGSGGIVVGGVFLVGLMGWGEVELEGLEVLDGCLECAEIIGIGG